MSNKFIIIIIAEIKPSILVHFNQTVPALQHSLDPLPLLIILTRQIIPHALGSDSYNVNQPTDWFEDESDGPLGSALDQPFHPILPCTLLRQLDWPDHSWFDGWVEGVDSVLQTLHWGFRPVVLLQVLFFVDLVVVTSG